MTRSRRWLKTMPQEILEGNPWEKGTKTRVKAWVKDNVRRKGSDAILWGRWNQCEEREDGEDKTRKKTGGESPKNRNPPTSRKQMRKQGEPQRKICRVAEQQMEEGDNSEAGKSTSWPPPGADGPAMRKPTSPSVQNSNKRQTKRTRKEEYRMKTELKAKIRREKQQ